MGLIFCRFRIVTGDVTRGVRLRRFRVMVVLRLSVLVDLRAILPIRSWAVLLFRLMRCVLRLSLSLFGVMM